jgi:hypothetical protein
LESRSKIPPQLGKPLVELVELLGAIGFRHRRFSVLPNDTSRRALGGRLVEMICRRE